MKNNGRLFAAAFAGLFAIIFIGAETAQAAGIALDRMVIEFSAGKRPVENLNVTNQSDKPAKIVASIVQVINTGLANETTQPAENLIVAPKAFELAPGAT
ncbi:MAG: hypothetical protein K8R48_05490, partial [Alphaproteobacteria bacterium]|nr:hypothetical protein [Alphaproteobacteria bacterium]